MRTSNDSINQLILTALEECQGYASGEDLSRQLGLSRAAIWKRIQVLRGYGYRIAAKPHLGYALVQRPDRLSSQEIERDLKVSRVAREFRTYEEVTSTNDLAYEMALRGAREGVAVIAEAQRRGRGRMGRLWFSPQGKNLYLSVILRPSIVPNLVPLLTYVGVISTLEALSASFALEAQVKWPNDVLVGGKKLAGLLNEVKAETDRVDFVVLGFGVNLNMEKELLPEDLRENTTSVMRELGHRVSRVDFTRCLLEKIDFWYDAFLSRGVELIIQKWESVAQIRGKRLAVESFGDLYRGVAEGLDLDGALILRTERNKRVRIVAGDVLGTTRT